MQRDVAEAMQRGSLYDTHYRVRLRDGAWRDIEARGRTFAGPDDKPVGLSGTCLDVTRRREAESRLAASEKKLRDQQQHLDLAASSGKLGLWDLDLLTDQAWRNEQHDRLFGFDSLQPEWGREICLRYVVPEDRPIFDRAFEEAFVTGHFHYELRINPVNQPVRWIEADGEVHRDGSGRPVRMMGTVKDVSDRKKAEAALRENQVQLALASRLAAMGTLVAGVAHEINNPLAAGIAGQGLALEVATEVRNRRRQGVEVDPEAEVRALDEIVDALTDAQEGAQRIARIVKDLATFARPDPSRVRVWLADVVEDARRWFPSAVALAGGVRVEDQGSPQVLASPGQLEQVVVNLVANAARAIPAGRKGDIVVRIRTGDEGAALLEVTDDGAGISPRSWAGSSTRSSPPVRSATGGEAGWGSRWSTPS